MADIREVELDSEGRVADRKIIIERPKRSGFGLGVLLGMFLMVGALLTFAYSQGSFQQAGVEADQTVAQVEQRTDTTINSAQQAADQTSETMTN